MPQGDGQCNSQRQNCCSRQDKIQLLSGRGLMWLISCWRLVDLLLRNKLWGVAPRLKRNNDFMLRSFVFVVFSQLLSKAVNLNPDNRIRRRIKIRRTSQSFNGEAILFDRIDLAFPISLAEIAQKLGEVRSFCKDTRRQYGCEFGSLFRFTFVLFGFDHVLQHHYHSSWITLWPRFMK